MKVVIIGSGKVAVFFAKKLSAGGAEIVQVFGRRLESITDFAAAVNAGPITNWNQLNLHADLYLIAVSDDAISDVAAKMPMVSGMIVHTAGAKPLSVLNEKFDRSGVIYPLQSINKYTTENAVVPLLLESNKSEDESVLKRVAELISPQFQLVTSTDRLKLHVSAVIVNNFPNYLYSLAHRFCEEQTVDFKLLMPLISETANRLYQFSPEMLQTGPAIRNDGSTINQHIEILKAEPELSNVYRQLTDAIVKSSVFKR